jgi:hypothetical protein
MIVRTPLLSMRSSIAAKPGRVSIASPDPSTSWSHADAPSCHDCPRCRLKELIAEVLADNISKLKVFQNGGCV